MIIPSFINRKWQQKNKSGKNLQLSCMESLTLYLKRQIHAVTKCWSKEWNPPSDNLTWAWVRWWHPTVLAALTAAPPAKRLLFQHKWQSAICRCYSKRHFDCYSLVFLLFFLLFFLFPFFYVMHNTLHFLLLFFFLLHCLIMQIFYIPEEKKDNRNSHHYEGTYFVVGDECVLVAIVSVFARHTSSTSSCNM